MNSEILLAPSSINSTSYVYMDMYDSRIKNGILYKDVLCLVMLNEAWWNEAWLAGIHIGNGVEGGRCLHK